MVSLSPAPLSSDPSFGDLEAYAIHVDPELVVQDANRAFLQDFGSDIVGASLLESCVLPDDQRRLRRAVRNAANQTESVSIDVRMERNGDSELRRLRVYPRQEPATGFLILGEAIREQATLTLSVPDSQQLDAYKHALDVSSIVAITDRAGKIIYVNNRMCEISQFERHELIGADHSILNSGYHSKEFFRGMWRTLNRGQVFRADIRNRAKDGSFYWVATTIIPVLDEDGKPHEFIAIRNEITERKLAEASLERTIRELAIAREQDRQHVEELQRALEQLEEANRRIREDQDKLVQTEKLSSIGYLSAGVAHEINNPLAGVMACVRALRKDTLKEQRRDAYFDVVEEGLDRIQHTVRSLLDYARNKPSDPKNYLAMDLVDRCWKLVAPVARKGDVEATFAEELSSVRLRVDRSQAMQAIMNLLLNAIQASSPGDTIEVTVVEKGEFVDLRITDRGSGMSEEVRKRACDPFFSTKPEGEGTGLGLAVTLSVANAHGGALEFDSEVGRGTTAVLRLPRTLDEKDSREDPPGG